MLTSKDYALLEVLREDGGYRTGIVARLAKFHYGGNARQRSGAVRSWLVNLARQGYVTLLDDGKPDCWRRTAKGSEALADRPQGVQ